MPMNHFDEHGDARMVDVSAKPVTARLAIAVAEVSLNDQAAAAVRRGDGRKGDVLGVARVAAVMAVKRTAELIPLCHPLPIDGVDVAFGWVDDHRLRCRVTVATTGRTGVEMEALTGAAAAVLTVYDMIKAVDRAAVIGPIRVQHKSGGASGSIDLPAT